MHTGLKVLLTHKKGLVILLLFTNKSIPNYVIYYYNLIYQII